MAILLCTSIQYLYVGISRNTNGKGDLYHTFLNVMINSDCRLRVA